MVKHQKAIYRSKIRIVAILSFSNLYLVLGSITFAISNEETQWSHVHCSVLLLTSDFAKDINSVLNISK